ncbi:MAG TPA: rRNA maturation RNase YbeY [Armatimonadota bacterium]|nr:rRNA maturation RNase YbeY [Armatimonadota bacterium]
MTVLVLNKQKRRLRRRWLEELAEAVMQAEGCHPEAELSVVIGDDGWIQELNREYRKKDRPTDVLAFPQDLSPAGTGPLLGDVAISAETAARQAQQVGHSLEQEMALLLTHGILHLAGWTDETPAKRRRMMRRAQDLLGRIQQRSKA